MSRLQLHCFRRHFQLVKVSSDPQSRIRVNHQIHPVFEMYGATEGANVLQCGTISSSCYSMNSANPDLLLHLHRDGQTISQKAMHNKHKDLYRVNFQVEKSFIDRLTEGWTSKYNMLSPFLSCGRICVSVFTVTAESQYRRIWTALLHENTLQKIAAS